VIARVFEEAGLPSVVIALIKEHAEKVKPSRALFVPFPYGYPMGKPNDAEFQHRVIGAALELLQRSQGPVLEDFPDEAGPTEFYQASAVTSTEDAIKTDAANEVTALRAFYERWIEDGNGRTAVGLSGIPQRRFRGMVGISNSGTGLYASSVTNYGVWGQSTEYRGITGRTGRVDDNYGLYTPDNLFAKNYTSTGTTSEVFKYTGESEILPGDIVSFSGIQAVGGLDDNPVVTVNSTDTIPEAAIAGVVASRFNLDAVRESQTDNSLDPTPAGAIQPGDYVLVVVRGPAAVNVDAEVPQTVPGSLLVSNADSRTLEAKSPNNASAAPVRGQTIGVLLGELPPSATKGNRSPQAGTSPRRQVYVYVSPR